jgi:hypothetical protein
VGDVFTVPANIIKYGIPCSQDIQKIGNTAYIYAASSPRNRIHISIEPPYLYISGENLMFAQYLLLLKNVIPF